MDVAFVEETQGDVSHQYRNATQQREILYGVLKLPCGALECAANRGGESPRDLADLSDGVAERNTRFEIKRNRDRRKLPQMVDRQRTRILRQFHECVARHEPAVVR